MAMDLVVKNGTIAGKFGSALIRPTVVTAGRPMRCAVLITPEIISAAPAIGSRRRSIGKAPAWLDVPRNPTT
jgi:hypothetical protein